MRKLLIALGILVPLSLGSVYGVNHLKLQRPLDQVLKDDDKNEGIAVRARYQHYLNPNVVVFDLRSIKDGKAPIDVFRVLLQYAAKLKDRRFEVVRLAFRGKIKFQITGEYFRTLGKKYGEQNPMYTLRTFPENLKRPDGTRAYPEWTGGALGVLAKQMEDFSDFHQKWYLEDR